MKGCDNCYYEYFDEKAYPCSLCIRGIERTDKWMPKSDDKHAVCTGCDYYDLPNAFHPCASCVDFSKYKPKIEDEPQTETHDKHTETHECVKDEPQTEGRECDD